MVQSAITLGQLADSKRISPLTSNVLRACAPFETSEIDVAAFLIAAARVGRYGSGPPNSATAWSQLAFDRMGPFLSNAQSTPSGWPELPISLGLEQAFTLAGALRDRIPGRDMYFGLRHVLAAI